MCPCDRLWCSMVGKAPILRTWRGREDDGSPASGCQPGPGRAGANGEKMADAGGEARGVEARQGALGGGQHGSAEAEALQHSPTKPARL